MGLLRIGCTLAAGARDASLNAKEASTASPQRALAIWLSNSRTVPAEGAGFEPAKAFDLTAFRGQLLKPLGHPSAEHFITAQSPLQRARTAGTVRLPWPRQPRVCYRH